MVPTVKLLELPQILKNLIELWSIRIFQKKMFQVKLRSNKKQEDLAHSFNIPQSTTGVHVKIVPQLQDGSASAFFIMKMLRVGTKS